MALNIGNRAATSGLTKAIYDQIRMNLEPGLADLTEEDLEPVREGWRNLSHAVATGVVEHLREHLEIQDPDTDAPPVLDVDGTTSSAVGGGEHTHGAGSLTVTLDNLTFE